MTKDFAGRELVATSDLSRWRAIVTISGDGLFHEVSFEASNRFENPDAYTGAEWYFRERRLDRSVQASTWCDTRWHWQRACKVIRLVGKPQHFHIQLSVLPTHPTAGRFSSRTTSRRRTVWCVKPPCEPSDVQPLPWTSSAFNFPVAGSLLPMTDKTAPSYISASTPSCPLGGVSSQTWTLKARSCGGWETPGSFFWIGRH